MEIIKRGKGYSLEFKCPVCGSVLLAEREELTLVRLGDNKFDFECPVCDEKRRITENNITKIFKH